MIMANSTSCKYRVGIDIGSTTIKTVILDNEDHLIFKSYERHLSETLASVKRNLGYVKDKIGTEKFLFALTGSSAMGIAQRCALPFEQEVIACACAVMKLIPQTDTVIELGGEDAKITYFRGTMEQRMNGACAGGTGSFIDQMATLLSTDASGLNELASRAKNIHTIASRCGVFAKTDIQALMNTGVSREDIALSVFQAVVNQTIGNLAQGRPIKGKVAFLGGPLHFLPELKKRFIATLEMQESDVVEAEFGNYFVALGAALCDAAQEIDVDTAWSLIEKSGPDPESLKGSGDLVLFKDHLEYEKFKERHDRDKVKRGKLENYTGRVFLGIDAGSTTTKMAVIGENHELLYTDYRSNAGTPLSTVIAELKDFYKVKPDSAKIGGCCSTGYGEDLVKAALHADLGEVETFAHLRAAREFCPDVTFVMDIGGQDMKCFFVRDGVIGGITLNEACSAGCGSFIETFAKSLHMDVREFARLAIDSKSPVDLGTRCTVFMNSRVKQAQKEGAAVADISAGISLSVIKNALFKVMQLRDMSTLGDKIVVQGGTFYNDAVLRAMETLLRRDVIRPDVAGLMGAYGAAILACESSDGTSTLLPENELDSFNAVSKNYRCKRCGNACSITMLRFPDGARYYSGNRCEKGAGGHEKSSPDNNIYQYKYERIFGYKPLENAPRGKIGLPRVLNMYEDYPFWFTLFTKLGFEVVLSDQSTPSMYCDGMATIPSESLCYPAKLSHGHILNLIDKGVKVIFYPCIPKNMDDEHIKLDNRYNCPVVASYPENIRGNMDILKEKHISFIQPFLPIGRPRALASRLHHELRLKHIRVSKLALSNAVTAAYKELEQYKADVLAKGKQILADAKEQKRPIILLAGRPYHVDPEINHGIPQMIASYNVSVISEDCVRDIPVHENYNGLVNQWSYHARLYHAAQVAAEDPDITLIQLSSFGCGLDAITTDQVKEILENHGRIYTMLKLDEVSNLGAARIRLRSLLAALSRRHEKLFEPIKFKARPRFTENARKTHTILAPQMAPVHFELFQSALHKYGYDVVIPPMPDREAIDLGLRYVNNDMCYPAIVVIGQMLQALRSGKYDPEHTSIMLFQTCGACRATNYMAVLRKALVFAGFPHVPVFALYGLETDAFKLSAKLLRDSIKAAVLGDTLMKLKNRVEPYELTPGDTQKMYRIWMDKCKEAILSGGTGEYKRTIAAMVKAFDKMPLKNIPRKPRVGIVGEILVKYHPIANNMLEKELLAENAEVVMPDFIDFFLYLSCDSIVEHDLLGGRKIPKAESKFFIKVVEHFRAPAARALARSKRFTRPGNIYHTMKLATRHVSKGNMAGEGWFLTGEMVKLIDEGVGNIVCLQPFGCLPNHITGKGVVHALRDDYRANIVTVDCDAGSSEVNQLNRLKLMLTVAKERNEQQKMRSPFPLKMRLML